MKLPKFTIKLDKDKLKDCGKAGLFTGLAILGTVAKNSLEDVLQNKTNEHIYKKSTYASVIAAIMDSDMWSSDKERAIELIPHNADPEIYGSILAVLKSSGGAWSSDKLRMIRTICEKIANSAASNIGKEDVKHE